MVAPTPVGRLQRFWGRSAVLGGALQDGPGLEDQIPLGRHQVFRFASKNKVCMGAGTREDTAGVLK
eukprot:SAG11_NODE_15909_length_563_cov_0.713362_1_plen_65_part_10